MNLAVKKYKIRDHEVTLYPSSHLHSIFNCSKDGVYKKIKRGLVPEPNFKTEKGRFLFSIEELAIIDYVYKEVWPYRQGVAVPLWVKELLEDAFAIAKKLIITYGYSQSDEDWEELDIKYTQFSKDRLQSYIYSWRKRFSNEVFFQELVDKESEV